MVGRKYASNPILGSSAPTTALEAASKGYVDSNLSSVTLIGPSGTDDTSRIQAAIDAQASQAMSVMKLQNSSGAWQAGNDAPGGGEVVLGPGIWKVTTLTLQHRTVLRGIGSGTVIYQISATTNPVIRNRRDGSVHAKYCQVKDLTVHGNKAGQSAANNGIHWFGDTASNYTNVLDEDYDEVHVISNVTIMNAKGNGIQVDGSSANRIINTKVHHCDGYGMRLGQDTHVSLCDIGWSGLAGIWIEGESCTIENVKCWYSGQITAGSGCGFKITADTGTLACCNSQDNTAQGFLFDGAFNMIATGLLADSNSKGSSGTYYGIDVYASNWNHIEGMVRNRYNAAGPGTKGLQIGGSSVSNLINVVAAASPWGVTTPFNAATDVDFDSHIYVNGQPKHPGTDLGGWVDCSRMTTAAQINAAANPSVCGANATIWLGPGTKDVNATLIVWGGQTWLGGGGRGIHTTLRAVSGLGAGLPIMAAEGWYNNAGDADEPITIRGILFDLNGQTGRHGLVIYNFWSWVDDCQFSNHSGTGIAGLHATDTSRTGTQSSNSHSENRYTACRFDDGLLGAMGFWSETTNSISNQDGHLTDCFFAGQSGASILIERAAGWTIQNNHLYGCGDNAIDLTRLYATKVIGNYIEDFGLNNVTTGPTAGYYAGISMSQVLDGKPSICMGNTIECKAAVTPAYNALRGIAARAGSGQNDARLNMIGNSVSLTGSATNTRAYYLGEAADTGRTLNLMFIGNQMDPRGTFATAVDKAGTTVRMMKDYVPTRAYTGVTTTHTLDNEFEMVQLFTVTGNVEIDPPASNVNARDGDPFQLTFLASGGTRTVTFDATMRTSTGITRGPYSIASGEVLRAAVEWSSLVSDYIITAATVSAN